MIIFPGFAADSAVALWHDHYIVGRLTAEPLSIEGHGATAWNDFDVFELQQRAACRQQRRIFDWAAAWCDP